MADDQQSATPFATPPPFYKHFTKQNNTQLNRIKKEASLTRSDDRATDENDHDVDVQQLPPELRFLIPPAPPSDGKWRSFGTEHDLDAPDPSLAEAGVEQLYPDHPSVKLAPQPHLLALARSLLTTFLSVNGILAQDPSLCEEKIQDLRIMTINMHDLINQYRPHQARESLIVMMEERVDKMRAEIKAIGDAQEKIEKILQASQSVGDIYAHGKSNGVQDGTSQGVEYGKRQIRQKAAWSALETSEEGETAKEDAAAAAAR